MSIKVTLRQKPISKNRQSLYLDFYPAITDPKTGISSRRRFLGSYIFEDLQDVKKRLKSIQDDKDNAEKNQNLIKSLKELIKLLKPLNPIDKEHNRVTLQRAEQIRQKLENNLNKPEIYTGYEKEQLKIKERSEKNFVKYFKELADKRKASNHDNWVSAYKYLETFTNGTLRFADIDEIFCNNFKEYLLNTKSNKSNKSKLSTNSAVSYHNKFKASLKQAYSDKYLSFDINSTIKSIKPTETRRNFLTIEELNILIKTECKNPLLKRAALFSALTGLRFVDIKNLVWDNVKQSPNNKNDIQLEYTQQKTGSDETLPISKQAVSLLGERKEPQSQIFEGLNYSAYENKHLAKWLGLAGIEKEITFHCFRHTFATLQLSQGTDIYTVSKMLGHKDLKTTQIYAKIIDQTKRNAADKIKLDF
jgi:integrase